MKCFPSLLASFVLAFALAAPAAAGDGIIHTGSPASMPPPATPGVVADADPLGGEPAADETTALDLVVEAALDCLHATLALF